MPDSNVSSSRIFIDKTKEIVDYYNNKLTLFEKEFGTLTDRLKELKKYVADARVLINDYKQGKPNYERRYVMAAYKLLFLVNKGMI